MTNDYDLPIIEEVCAGEVLNMLIDTGSGVSLLDGTKFHELKGKMSVRPLEGSCLIKSITGEEIPTSSRVWINLHIKGRDLELDVYVMKFPLNSRHMV